MNGLLFIINTAGRLELHTEEELPSIVVERCANYLKTGKILSGTYEIKATGEKKFTSTVDFILKKDNLVTLDGKSSQEIFDGKWHFVANKLEKTYVLKDPRITGIPYQVGFEAFTKVKGSGLEKVFDPSKAVATVFDGRPMVAIKQADRTIYISPQTALPYGVEMTLGAVNYELRFTKLDLNPNVAENSFRISPPVDYKFVPYDFPTMLKVGKKAPKLESPAQTALDALSTQHPTIVLIFVNENEPSKETLESMNKMAATKDKISFVVITGSEKVAGSSKRLSNLNFVVDNSLGTKNLASAYGVAQYPSIYVTTDDGTLIHRQIGGTESFLQMVLNR